MINFDETYHNLSFYNEFAKLLSTRAFVLYVLSCLTCFIPYVLLRPRCFVPYVLSSLECLVPYVSSPLCILLTQMPHESHSLHFLCTSYSCHTCSLAPYHSLASGVSSLTYTYPSHILYVSCLVALLSLALELFETFTEWLRLIVVICYF